MGATIRIAILAQAAKAKAEMKTVADRAKEMGEKAKEAGLGILKAAAPIASFASLLGPATAGVLGLAHGLSVAAANAAAMAPALGPLLAVKAGLEFLKFTLSGIAKQMGETLKPLGEAFKAAQVEAGKLASKELPALASAFQKVNLPNISDAMNRIGKSAGDSVGVFGRWVNSAPGIKLIKDITDGTASAFERAAPSITAAAISLGNMVGRSNASERLAALGDVVARLADKFNAWTDSVTSADIDNALTKAGNAAGFVTDKLKAIKDIVGWMAENQGKVKAFSDAIAGLGIVLGIATGNPIAVAIGAFTLLTNHWDTVKAAFSGAAGWWSGVWSGMKASPELQSFGQTVADSARRIWEALKAAFEQIKTAVLPPLRELWTTIRTQVVPALDGFVQAMTPIVTFLIGKLAPVVSQVFASIINVIRGALTVISGVIKVVTGIITGDWSKAWDGVKSIVSGAWTIIKAVISAGWAAIKATFSAIGPALKAIATAAWNLVKSAFSSGVSNAVAAAKELPGKVKSGLGNLGSFLYSAGQDIIRGLINGIKAMAGQAVSAARGVVSDAVSGAKNLLGIASPSKVFREIGTNVGKGLAIGLQASRDIVKKATDKLTEVIKMRDDYAKSLADSVSGDGISGIIDSTQNKNGSAGIIKGLQDRLDAIRRFQGGLNILRRKGFGERVVQDIANAGLEQGLAFVDQLRTADAATIRRVRALDSQITSASEAIGRVQAQAQFQAQANAATKVVTPQVVIRLDSSGSKADDFLLEVLRRSIRAAGGNVQAVLGRS